MPKILIFLTGAGLIMLAIFLTSFFKIKTREAPPITAAPIVAKIASTNFAITQDGQLVQGADSKLSLYLPDNTKPTPDGRIEDKEVFAALNLASLVAKSDFVATNVRFIDQESVAFYDQDGTIVIFSTQKPATGQVDSLQLVLSKAKIDASKIAKIDLRFDKPVIVYKNSQ